MTLRSWRNKMERMTIPLRSSRSKPKENDLYAEDQQGAARIRVSVVVVENGHSIIQVILLWSVLAGCWCTCGH